jgi:protein-tyrosine phosphatase
MSAGARAMPSAAPGRPRRLLFVCTGNICRSPTAEAVMRKLVAGAGLQGRIDVDSAGTHNYHVGEPPDERSQLFAARRGYDLSALRARQLEPADFRRFDMLLAMDEEHLRFMRRMCPSGYEARLRRLMEFARRHASKDVPDPYYRGDAAFELVLDYVEDACSVLLDELRRRWMPAEGNESAQNTG